MFGFDHVSISVDNLEETVKFYQKLGFAIHQEYHGEDSEYVLLTLDGNFLEVFKYPDMDPLPSFAKDVDKDLSTIGTKHLGLSVKDINEAKKWIEDNNLSDEEIVIHHGRIDGIGYFFIKDPNGILIEIIEER